MLPDVTRGYLFDAFMGRMTSDCSLGHLYVRAGSIPSCPLVGHVVHKHAIGGSGLGLVALVAAVDRTRYYSGGHLMGKMRLRSAMRHSALGISLQGKLVDAC